MSPPEAIVYVLMFIALFPVVWQFSIMALFITIRAIYG